MRWLRHSDKRSTLHRDHRDIMTSRQAIIMTSDHRNIATSWQATGDHRDIATSRSDHRDIVTWQAIIATDDRRDIARSPVAMSRRSSAAMIAATSRQATSRHRNIATSRQATSRQAIVYLRLNLLPVVAFLLQLRIFLNAPRKSSLNMV